MGSVTQTSRQRHIYKGREADKVGKSKHLTSEQGGMVKFANLGQIKGRDPRATQGQELQWTIRLTLE